MRLLAVKDVMGRYNVGRHTAMSLIHQSGPVRIGNLLRVRPEDLEATIARRRERTEAL